MSNYQQGIHRYGCGRSEKFSFCVGGTSAGELCKALKATYSYLPNGQDRRLLEIAHTGRGGVAVSAFGYGYDAGGNSTRWTQSQPFHAVEPMSAWRIEQDVAEQLTGVFV
jgi:hypothetical protein